MAYSKEYYESHKEQMKAARDKYRKGTPEALERTRKINRDRYNALPPEKKALLSVRQKERRAMEIDKTRIRCRIDARNRQIKQYKKNIEQQESYLFELKMKDTWESSDFKYADTLNARIRELEKKIELKKKEIEELKKTKEEM